ncbi:hypothetical protein MSG28_009651 [Choristoneura fumiferana]|uniref:Uncharacterized protein n=1 Tax=Choristoneura fumiferana TaxID=7141 RepID=A0ACC0JC38_CHOFU|nr:hypothetical protein MSG28_009651 [Choristoneura fumiferana]
MAAIALIFIFLLNRAKTAQISVTTLNPALEVNKLPEGSTDAIFALQIRQIRTTSEATPAASAGNNLNVVGASAPGVQPQSENYQAIPTIYPHQNKKVTDKKYDDEHEGNFNLSAFDRNAKEKEMKAVDTNIKPLALVWDSCMETNFRDNQRISIQPPLDMQDADHDSRFQKNRQIGSIWSEGLSKRDAADTNNSIAIKSWLNKYNNLRASNTVNGPVQKSDSLLIRKIAKPSTTMIPSTTIQMIPITRDIFNNPTESFNMSVDVVVTENNIRASYTEDWFEAKDRSKIRFGGPPQTETYLIPTLKPEEGFHPFGSRQGRCMGKVFISLLILAALIIPAYMLILCLLSLFSKSGCDEELETGALFPDADESDYNDRVLVVVTLFVALFLLISGMAVSNEQATAAALDSQNMLSCACADIATWLSAAARELHHSLVPPMDIVVQAYREDLRNVGSLLGDPVRQAIASESGIDLVFDSLADIITESEDLGSKIASLRDVSIRAGALASTASDRIKDLAKQLDNLKKHCTSKDAPLCDTVNTHSLEMQLKFDLILREQQLLELRSLGVENLTRAISAARQEFQTLPHAISTQTTQIREAILRDIEAKRQSVQGAVRILSDIVRHLTAACVVAVGFVMTLVLLAMICGCGNRKEHAKRTLQVSAVWMCLASLVLWGVISAIFVIAGHAEVFVCRALWDTPQYETLDCEKDRPAYIVFQLDKVLDINKETSYFEWDKLQIDFAGLSSSIDVRFLKTISVNFNKLLNRILQVSDVNLSKYRTQRLHLTSIKPLEQLRADVVYKLTELELQLLPFRRKLNISLSHIYTAQYYIDNQGETIANKKVSMYVSRLISHVAGWRTHALASAGKHAARCRPLFNVYEAARALLCTRYIGSLTTPEK